MDQIGLRFPGAAVSRKRKQEKIDSILEWLATFHFSSRAILLQVMGLEREKDGYFKSLRESFYIKEMMYPTYHKPIIMLGDYGYVLARERHVAMLHYKRRANSINMSNIRHDLAVQSAILRSGISLEQVTPERLIERNRLKTPDAIYDVDGISHALEVELHAKSERDIFIAFLDHGRAWQAKEYQRVRYLFREPWQRDYYERLFRRPEWPRYEYVKEKRMHIVDRDRPTVKPSEYKGLLDVFSFELDSLAID